MVYKFVESVKINRTKVEDRVLKIDEICYVPNGIYNVFLNSDRCVCTPGYKYKK